MRVPSPEEEDNRQLNRELRSLKKEKTLITYRHRGTTSGARGLGLSPGRSCRTRKLVSIRLWDGSPLQPELNPSPAARVGACGVSASDNSCRWRGALKGANGERERTRTSTRYASLRLCAALVSTAVGCWCKSSSPRGYLTHMREVGSLCGPDADPISERGIEA